MNQRIQTAIVRWAAGILAFFGSIGAFISTFGLCACTLVPLLSLLGLFSLIIGFLSHHGPLFITLGVLLLVLSYFQTKRPCKLHKRRKYKTKNKTY